MVAIGIRQKHMCSSGMSKADEVEEKEKAEEEEEEEYEEEQDKQACETGQVTSQEFWMMYDG